jgi:hypothetical protein
VGTNIGLMIFYVFSMLQWAHDVIPLKEPQLKKGQWFLESAYIFFWATPLLLLIMWLKAPEHIIDDLSFSILAGYVGILAFAAYVQTSHALFNQAWYRTIHEFQRADLKTAAARSFYAATVYASCTACIYFVTNLII